MEFIVDQTESISTQFLNVNIFSAKHVTVRTGNWLNCAYGTRLQPPLTII